LRGDERGSEGQDGHHLQHQVIFSGVFMARREFHFVEGTSKKFWVIDLKGSEFTVDWGRIGTAGQTKTKKFGSEAEAKKQYDKLVAEKTGKGYTEVGGAGATAPDPRAAVKAAAPAKAAAEAAAEKAAPETAAAPKAEPMVVATKRAAAPKVTPPTTVAYPAERRINLDPEDWRWATWRKIAPRPRPAAVPFDLDNCVRRLLKLQPEKYGWHIDFRPASIKSPMSPQEGHFWLTAIKQICEGADRTKKVSMESIATQLQGMTFSGEYSFPEFKDVFANYSVDREAAMRCFVPVLNPARIQEMVAYIDETLASHNHYGLVHATESFACVFREHVLPYLTETEADELRGMVRRALPQYAGTHYYVQPLPRVLAAMLHMPDEMRAIVAEIPNEAYKASPWTDRAMCWTDMVLGLPTADEVLTQAQRIGLLMHAPDRLRGWLATTEYKGLQLAVDSILKTTRKDEVESLMRVLALVEAPDLAPLMLQLQAESKTPRMARDWLDEHPAHAVEGLVPVALDQGKYAEAAQNYLAGIRRRGCEDMLRKALADQPAEVQEKLLTDAAAGGVQVPELTEAESPAWLTADVKQAVAGWEKRLKWVDVGVLPPILLDGKRLSEGQVKAVCTALRTNAPCKPGPLIAGLKEHAGRESLDKFAWRLFQEWVGLGAVPKEKWAMMAVGAIGGDGCVLKMTPLIRAWPGESQHQRAVLGLECLRTIGTDTALMALNGIAQKLKFKALKAKAMEMMEAIAADRKMTRAELEDRIVPDCDLDERGTRIFDFGPRQFRFVLGPDMKPMLKDADNKMRGNLPTPNTKDDAAKAAAAVEAWKVLKKTVQEVTKVQAVRLEQSMVTGRRWTAQSFEQLLVKHPLMTNLARLLIWGGYDDAGNLRQTFRVTEDQTLADERDGTCALGDVKHIGIAHPAHMTEEQRQRWGDILGDYELIPPFRQLGRPVYRLEGDEPNQREITRFKDEKVEALVMIGMLERMSWQRGVPEDAGVVHEHSKTFYGAGVTAVLQYEIGVPVGYMDGWEDQTLARCFFVPGMYTPTIYPKHPQALLLKYVDYVVMSEVLKDLTAIASKAK
jgi:predicted DNA-binding WGR domain protein